MDPHNTKALLRRGTCYEHIEKYKKSMADLEHLLTKDPNSKQAKDVLNRVKRLTHTYTQWGLEHGWVLIALIGDIVDSALDLN